MSTLQLILAVPLIGTILVAVAALRAPEGFQDDRGFHFGPKE
jgi:hypothetical protein